MRQTLRLICMCLPVFAYGHGINGHVWVTERAIEQSSVVPPSADCHDAILFGSIFPDSGYAVNHEYGELMHWAPFLNAGLNALAEIEDEQEKLVTACFLAGIAAHGQQDEVFDSFFLPQVLLHDVLGQDALDPFLDAYMVINQLATSKPKIVLPGAFLVDVLQRDFGMEVTVDKLELGARTIKSVVIDNFHILAPNFVQMYEGDFGWTRENFLEPTTVGGLVSEIEVTKAFLDSLLFQRGMPESPPDFLSSFDGATCIGDHGGEVLGRCLVLGRGVMVGSLFGGIHVRDEFGESHLVNNIRGGRWTTSDGAYTRVLFVELDEGLLEQNLSFRASQSWMWIDGGESSLSWWPMLQLTDTEDATIAGGSDLGIEESDEVPVESYTGGSSCRFQSVRRSWIANTLLFCVFCLVGRCRRRIKQNP